MKFPTAFTKCWPAILLALQLVVGGSRAGAVNPQRGIVDPSLNESPIRQEEMDLLPKGQKMVLQPWQIPPLAACTTGGFLFNAGGCFVAGAAAGTGPSPALTVWTLPGKPETRPQEQWNNSGVAVAAWSACAQWNDTVISAGGLLDGKPVATVASLRIAGGKLSLSHLPALPMALAGAGAAIIGQTLYVFGGISSLEPVVEENGLWKLDLGRPGARWEAGPPLPAGGRAFFAATAQYDILCVFGGVVAQGAGRLGVSKQAWAYRPEPLEGTRDFGWKRWSDLPEPRAGALAIPLGQASVMVLGGASRLESTTLLAAANLTEPDALAPPLLFHTLTDAWCDFDRPVGLASPIAVKNGRDVLVLGGATSGGKTVTLAREIQIPRSVRNLAWIDYVFIGAYFTLLAGIGFWFSRKQDSSAEFSLGGRKVKWWAAGISMFATAASAITFMAVPALAFATNLVWTLPLIMMVPAYYITGYFIYPLLRRMEITSTYEYLERRFNRPLRLIASGQCILFLAVGRTSFVLVLPALAISAVTGVSVFTSVWVMGILTTVYTSLGGFEAVIWTEVFQGLLKFLAPLAMIIVCLLNLPHGRVEFLQTGLHYHKFDLALLTWDYTVPAIWIVLIFTLLQNTVNQAGDQPVIQRVFSTPLREVRRVTAMSITCGIVIGVIANVLGIAIFTYFHAHPEKFDPNARNDQIVALFVTQAMPAGAAGIVIAAIFASAMATVASSMNSVATVFTEDFYLRVRPQAPDKERLLILKSTSYVAGAVGTGFALMLASLNLNSMMSVWTQIGALLGGGGGGCLHAGNVYQADQWPGRGVRCDHQHRRDDSGEALYVDSLAGLFAHRHSILHDLRLRFQLVLPANKRPRRADGLHAEEAAAARNWIQQFSLNARFAFGSVTD